MPGSSPACWLDDTQSAIYCVHRKRQGLERAVVYTTHAVSCPLTWWKATRRLFGLLWQLSVFGFPGLFLPPVTCNSWSLASSLIASSWHNMVAGAPDILSSIQAVRRGRDRAQTSCPFSFEAAFLQFTPKFCLLARGCPSLQRRRRNPAFQLCTGLARALLLR